MSRRKAQGAPGGMVAREAARAFVLKAPSLHTPVNGAFAAQLDSGGYPGGSGPAGPALRWWAPPARDPAGDTLRWLPLQRGQSRELARSNPIAGGAIATNVDRVVGTGLALVARPNCRVLGWSDGQAMDWKSAVQQEFSLWADSPSCDLRGEHDFYDKQRLTLGSSLESGDCFTVLPEAAPTQAQPYRLRLQTLEADRVGNPDGRPDDREAAGGIRRSADAVSYFVYDNHPGVLAVGPGRYAGSWIDRAGPSGRRRMLHHYRQLRPEQPRGVPYLSVIAEHLKQLGRYTEAEITAAVAAANITGVIETPAGTGVAPVFGITDAQAAANPEIQMAAGAVLGLAPGEKFVLADPSRPNQAFQPFILAIVQQIGVGLGVPYELLVKQFNASYSASKAALLDAWMRFRSERVWLARSLCQPVYETWLAEAVAGGRIAAPGFFADPLMRWAYTRASWHGDSMGSINPKDEVEGYTAAIEARVMSRERAEWELFGTDWYETFDAKANEQRMLGEHDLLPVPRPGAPAGGGRPAPEASDSDAQLAALHADVRALLAREPAAAAPITLNVQPPSVEIHQGDIQISLPESNIQLDAHIEQPDVIVHPPHVQAAPRLARERVVTERDSNGLIVRFEEREIEP